MYYPDSRVPKSCGNPGGNLAEFSAKEHKYFRVNQVSAFPPTPA